MLNDPRVLGFERVHLVVLNQRHGLNATTHSDIHTVNQNLLGGNRNRHQARGTLAIHAHAGHFNRQARTNRSLTCHVTALGTLLKRCTDDDIFDFATFETGALDCVLDRVTSECLRLRVVERTAVSLTNGSACR